MYFTDPLSNHRQRAAYRTPRAAFRASARALRKRGLTLLARGGEVRGRWQEF